MEKVNNQYVGTIKGLLRLALKSKGFKMLSNEKVHNKNVFIMDFKVKGNDKTFTFKIGYKVLKNLFEDKNSKELFDTMISTVNNIN